MKSMMLYKHTNPYHAKIWPKIFNYFRMVDESSILKVDAFGPYRSGSKGFTSFEMKHDRGILLREALDGLDIWFFGNTSSCPDEKKLKLATNFAPNVLIKTLEA